MAEIGTKAWRAVLKCWVSPAVIGTEAWRAVLKCLVSPAVTLLAVLCRLYSFWDRFCAVRPLPYCAYYDSSALFKS